MNLVYVLQCPTTNNPVYVGKTKVGIKRPYMHIKEKSHSEKVNLWVKSIKDDGYEPTLNILENLVTDDLLSAKELFWINYFLSKGYSLLNQQGIEPLLLNAKIIEYTSEHDQDYLADIRTYIKYNRKLSNLSQKDLSDKSGVGLRVIRDLEQGTKTNFNTDVIFKILKLFGRPKLAIKERT